MICEVFSSWVCDIADDSTDVIEQSSSETDSFSCRHEIAFILWNHKVHFHVHNILSIFLVLRQILKSIVSHSLNILFNITITHTQIFLVVSSLRCSYQNPVCIFLSRIPPVTPTSSVLILRVLPIIFRVIQFMDLFTVHFYLDLVTFPLQKPNNFLSTLFLHALSLWKATFHPHIQQREKLCIFLYILTLKRRIKSHLPFAGIISSSPYSPR
jgi:hypothetical protein